QKQKLRNENYGYARDFVDVVSEVLPDIANKGIKIISNAGGVNILDCKDHILKAIDEQSIDSIKVDVDDSNEIDTDIAALTASGHSLSNMETGEPVSAVKDQLLSADVYFGSRLIVEALELGADIVITGRVTDTGLTLAPMIREFGWSFDDYDKMSA